MAANAKIIGNAARIAKARYKYIWTHSFFILCSSFIISRLNIVGDAYFWVFLDQIAEFRRSKQQQQKIYDVFKFYKQTKNKKMKKTTFKLDALKYIGQ